MRLSGFLRYLVCERKTKILTTVQHRAFFWMQLHPTSSILNMPMTLLENKSLFSVGMYQGYRGDLSCPWDKGHFLGIYTPEERRLRNTRAHPKEFSKGQNPASMQPCWDPIQASSVMKEPERQSHPGGDPRARIPSHQNGGVQLIELSLCNSEHHLQSQKLWTLDTE